MNITHDIDTYAVTHTTNTHKCTHKHVSAERKEVGKGKKSEKL